MSSTFTYNLNDLLLCHNDDAVWPDCLSVLLHHLTEYTNELVLMTESHIFLKLTRLQKKEVGSYIYESYGTVFSTVVLQ